MGHNDFIAVCPRDCYDTCFFRARKSDEGIFLELLEVPFGPEVRSLCPRAAKDYQRALSQKRVLYPHIAIRKGEQRFERASWDEALEKVTTELQRVLKEYGSEKILLLDYAGNRGVFTRYLPQRLWYLLRASRTDYSICDRAGEEALRLHYGSTYGALIDQMCESRLLIYWGFNATVVSLHNFHIALNLRKKKNSKIIVIDTLKNETARQADLWLRPKYGSDIYLALGIANYLIEHELYDKSFVENYCEGFEKFKEYVKKFSLDVVSEKTGIAKEKIIEFAELYAREKPSIIFIGYRLQRRIGGGETVRAVSLLPALIGIHRGFYYSNTDGLLIDINYLRGTHLGSPARIIPQPKVGEYLSRGEFKFVFIFLTNPAATHPNAELVMKGLLRDDVFVVVHETHWTDTALCADVVLPAPTWLEKEDVVFSYWHDYIGFSNKLMEPLGESRTEIWLMREIARRLGITRPEIFENELDALKKALPEHIFKELIEKKYTRLPYRPLNEYQTPSGKIEFWSKSASNMKREPFPTPIDIEPPPEYPFILVSSASPKYTHTQFEDVYGDIPPIIMVSEEDMARLGIRDNDIVRVESTRGSVLLRAKKSDLVPPGIVFTYRSCRTLDGKRINVITSDDANELYGAALNSTFVRLVRAGEET